MGPWEHKYPTSPGSMPPTFMAKSSAGSTAGSRARTAAGATAPGICPPTERSCRSTVKRPRRGMDRGPAAGSQRRCGRRPGWCREPCIRGSRPTRRRPDGTGLVLRSAEPGSAAGEVVRGAGQRRVRRGHAPSRGNRRIVLLSRDADRQRAGRRPGPGRRGVGVLRLQAPLTAAMELLGRPVMEFAFSANRPAAQLCFRLCDVAPGGASARITWRAFNLTHHAGPEAPAALRPGRIYRACVELNECAHRVRAGHRLRLAVSTSYWPVIWPAPVTATVTLRLAGCRLILPERRAADEIDPAHPGAPSDFPVHAAETLRAPENRTSSAGSIPAARTCWRRSTISARAATRSTGWSPAATWSSATRFTRTIRCRLATRPAGATSSGAETGRCGSTRESVMTSDEESFHLDRAVTAREGGEIAISLRWKESIARGAAVAGGEVPEPRRRREGTAGVRAAAPSIRVRRRARGGIIARGSGTPRRGVRTRRFNRRGECDAAADRRQPGAGLLGAQSGRPRRFRSSSSPASGSSCGGIRRPTHRVEPGKAKGSVIDPTTSRRRMP